MVAKITYLSTQVVYGPLSFPSPCKMKSLKELFSVYYGKQCLKNRSVGRGHGTRIGLKEALTYKQPKFTIDFYCTKETRKIWGILRFMQNLQHENRQYSQKWREKVRSYTKMLPYYRGSPFSTVSLSTIPSIVRFKIIQNSTNSPIQCEMF